MKMIYIASPYTIGDVAQNVKRQIDAANELMDKGFCPVIPLLSHFQHMVHPRPYADWMEIDKEKLKRCDAVLRLPGESKGADIETTLATELKIPVFKGINWIQIYFSCEK